jgi:AcrR family transcriptional regulator
MVTENPRLTRSRQALIRAMTTMLDSNLPAAGMTITDVVRLAGVSRPTFYQHFGDLSALMRGAALARLEATFAKIPDAALGESWTMFVRATFRTLLADLHFHARFYLTALQGPGGYALSADLVGYLAKHLLDASPLGPIIRRRVDADSATGHAELLAAGTVWHVVRWLETDFTGTNTIDAMVDRISLLLLSASGATESEIEAVRSESAPADLAR